MSAIFAKIKAEPVAVAGLISAVIAVVVSLGIDVSDGTKAAVLGLAAAILALVARSQVTPTP